MSSELERERHVPQVVMTTTTKATRNCRRASKSDHADDAFWENAVQSKATAATPEINNVGIASQCTINCILEAWRYLLTDSVHPDAG
jgi:hypothetical protein